jgi:hypothetical protein
VWALGFCRIGAWPLIGFELVAGYLAAWTVRKARRAGERLDQDADEVMDAGLDRLHDLILAKLGPDPAVEKLEKEAAEGLVSVRTERRVLDAVIDAAENDGQFATELGAVLAALRLSGAPAGVTASGERSAAVGGNAEIRAEHGSAAALTMSDVRIGGPAVDPTGPGQGQG